MMKNLNIYLPLVLIAAAAVAGVYFFWYKPEKDAKDAALAAVQADHDKELQVYKDKFTNVKNVAVSYQAVSAAGLLRNRA